MSVYLSFDAEMAQRCSVSHGNTPADSGDEFGEANASLNSENNFSMLSDKVHSLDSLASDNGMGDGGIIRWDAMRAALVGLHDNVNYAILFYVNLVA